MPIDESRVIWDDSGVQWDEPEPAKKVPGVDYSDRAWSDVAIEAVKTLPSSTQQYFGDIYEAVSSPVETATSLGKLGAGVLATGKVAVDELLGQPPSEESQQIASNIDPVVDFLKNRYGSVAAVKKTLATDPAGVAGDLSAVLTGGGAVAKNIPGATRTGAAIEKVGRAIEPLNLATKTAGAVIPQWMPERLYESAVKFADGKKVSAEDAKKLTRTALDFGIEPSRKGVKKAIANVQYLSGELDSIIDNLTQQGVELDVTQAAKSLDKLRAEASYMSAPEEYYKAIDKLEEEFIRHHGYRVKTPEDVQKMKQATYQELKKYYDSPNRPTGGRAMRNEGKAALASEYRRILGELHPEINTLNATEGALLELIKAIDAPAKRIGKRDILGLGTTAKVGVGSAIGGAPGMVAGGVAAALDIPQVKVKLARVLELARKRARLEAKRKTKIPMTGVEIPVDPTKARLALRGAGVTTEEEQ